MLEVKLNEEKYWKKLIEELQEGIALLDENNKIFYHNPSLGEIFGLDQSKEEEISDLSFKVNDIKINMLKEDSLSKLNKVLDFSDKFSNFQEIKLSLMIETLIDILDDNKKLS